MAYSYFTAAINTRLVGKQVAMLVKNLEDHYETDIRKRTHLIGFSLGGQVSGNAGMFFNELEDKRVVSGCQKINHITGIDVAGPFFENADLSLRLDPTDACFVDAIHTHGFLKGIKRKVGHIDFYPNGGMQQPGCGAGKSHNSFCWFNLTHTFFRKQNRRGKLNMGPNSSIYKSIQFFM